MRVGFSGPRKGMTNDQLLHVHMLLGDLRTAGATQASHGMCVGSDLAFHEMAQALGYFMIGCPGVTTDGKLFMRADDCACDLVMPEKPFLVRSRDIVTESDLMIITPYEMVPQFRGSGTWASIRYAREARKPLILLWPDGTSTVEHVSGMETAEQYRELLVRRRTDGSILSGV